MESKLTIFVVCLLNLILLPCYAEEYSIKLIGDELKNISAIEIEVEFDPIRSFILDDSFSIHSGFDFETLCKDVDPCPHNIIEGKDLILFKTVDQSNSLIRVFFAKALEKSELLLHGDLLRMNYSGEAKAKIKKINFIPDFGESIDSSKIVSKLEIFQSDDALPFMGISKVDLLGPRQRIFSDNMFIILGNIETYGFTLGKSIRKPRINGQTAKFFTDKIIAVNLSLENQNPNRDLEIVLELDVDGQTISKTAGKIKFVSD